MYQSGHFDRSAYSEISAITDTIRSFLSASLHQLATSALLQRLLELCFEGRNASVYGDNAAGKTSVYDALTFLFFGKDSTGQEVGDKGAIVKPLDAAGEVVDHQAITAVEAELLVDGEMITLKRTLREVWVTKRGCGEAVYSGNTSEYYINDVPMKKNLFDERIKEIVPEEQFRMLTSVSLFAQDLDWRKRRAVLFDMAGTLTDRQIMAREERFLPLLEDMGKLEPEDYKAKLLAQRRGLAGSKNEIPARISECQRAVEELEGLDFEGARIEAKRLEEQKEQLTKQK